MKLDTIKLNLCIRAAATLQDAANQIQQTALQKFGTGKFGQSTFQ